MRIYVYRDEGFAIDFYAMGIFQIHSREFEFKKHGNDFKKSHISRPCYLDAARIRGIPIDFIKLHICTHTYTYAYIRETRPVKLAYTVNVINKKAWLTLFPKYGFRKV